MEELNRKQPDVEKVTKSCKRKLAAELGPPAARRLATRKGPRCPRRCAVPRRAPGPPAVPSLPVSAGRRAPQHGEGAGRVGGAARGAGAPDTPHGTAPAPLAAALASGPGPAVPAGDGHAAPARGRGSHAGGSRWPTVGGGWGRSPGSGGWSGSQNPSPRPGAPGQPRGGCRSPWLPLRRGGPGQRPLCQPQRGQGMPWRGFIAGFPAGALTPVCASPSWRSSLTLTSGSGESGTCSGSAK